MAFSFFYVLYSNAVVIFLLNLRTNFLSSFTIETDLLGYLAFDNSDKTISSLTFAALVIESILIIENIQWIATIINERTKRLTLGWEGFNPK